MTLPLFNRFSFYRRLPLAWLMLKRHPTRFVTALLGIAASGVLILMQLVIQDSLFQSSLSIINKIDADLLLFNKQSVSLISFMSFPEERLSSVLKSPYVKKAFPVRFRFLAWRLDGDSKKRLAMAVGINPTQQVFTDRSINLEQKKLVSRGNILYDVRSRPEFGNVAKKFKTDIPTYGYAGSQRLNVVGLISFGPSFGYDASMLMNMASISDFNTTDDYSKIKPIELGVIKLVDGVSPKLVAKTINPTLPPDMVLMTKSEFQATEQSYWNTSKPIGFVFSFMTIMSLFVGGIMVYQLLHMDATFHLPSYAVLMSIGYKRAKLEGIVFAEGIILSTLAFPAAFICSVTLCRVISGFTLMNLNVTFNMASSTYFLLLFMCSTSSLLAMSKIKDADPADLF
jgi:putative ABC transport system permease protein